MKRLSNKLDVNVNRKSAFNSLCDTNDLNCIKMSIKHESTNFTYNK